MIFEKRASFNGNVRKKVNWVVGPHTSDATICLARIQGLKNPLTSEKAMVLMLTENFLMLCSEISAITKQGSPEPQSSVCENPINGQEKS